jgi:plasmid stability protein
MATLYVERVPDDLYSALRARARANRRSISAETISVLEQMVPSRGEQKRREAFYRRVLQIRRRAKPARPGPSAEELLREDRNR